jgi:hypothetical protein
MHLPLRFALVDRDRQGIDSDLSLVGKHEGDQVVTSSGFIVARLLDTCQDKVTTLHVKLEQIIYFLWVMAFERMVRNLSDDGCRQNPIKPRIIGCVIGTREQKTVLKYTRI